MSSGAAVMGGTMGVIWVVATLYFLIRRFKSPYKEMSTPEDYLLLLLVLGVVAMGDHLRFFAHVPTSVYQQWAHSLLTFHPALPATLVGGARISFVVHVLLADLLLAYLPFSKLVHFVGTFFTNAIRRS
jgi:nitrate reductase gamma subunit